MSVYFAFFSTFYWLYYAKTAKLQAGGKHLITTKKHMKSNQITEQMAVETAATWEGEHEAVAKLAQLMNWDEINDAAYEFRRSDDRWYDWENLSQEVRVELLQKVVELNA